MYQLGGGDRPVLFRRGHSDLRQGSTAWIVGPSSALENCSVSYSGQDLESHDSAQPSGGPPTDPVYSAYTGWSDLDARPCCFRGCDINFTAGWR